MPCFLTIEIIDIYYFHVLNNFFWPFSFQFIRVTRRNHPARMKAFVLKMEQDLLVNVRLDTKERPVKQKWTPVKKIPAKTEHLVENQVRQMKLSVFVYPASLVKRVMKKVWLLKLFNVFPFGSTGVSKYCVVTRV